MFSGFHSNHLVIGPSNIDQWMMYILNMHFCWWAPTNPPWGPFTAWWLLCFCAPLWCRRLLTAGKYAPTCRRLCRHPTEKSRSLSPVCWNSRGTAAEKWKKNTLLLRLFLGFPHPGPTKKNLFIVLSFILAFKTTTTTTTTSNKLDWLFLSNQKSFMNSIGSF